MSKPELEDRGNGSRDTAGQEEKIQPEKEKEMPKSELEDRDNEVKVATGYDPRMLAAEIDSGRHINPDAATMSKQE